MVGGIKVALTQKCTQSSHMKLQVFSRSLTIKQHRLHSENLRASSAFGNVKTQNNLLSIQAGLLTPKRWSKVIPTGNSSKFQNKIPEELLQEKVTEDSLPPKKTYLGANDILEDLHKRLGEPEALKEFHKIRDNHKLSLAEQWSAVAHKLLGYTVHSICANGFYPKKESIIEWRQQKYELLTSTNPSIPGTFKTYTPEEALMQQDIMKDLNRTCWVIPFEHGFREGWQESSLQIITLPRLHKILEDLVKDFQSVEFKYCMHTIKVDLLKQQMSGMKPEIIQKTLYDKIIPLYDRVLAKHQLPGEHGWVNFQIAMFDFDADPIVRSQSDNLNSLLVPHDMGQRQMPPK